MSGLPPPPASGPDGQADADASVVLARITQAGSRGAAIALTALHRTIELLCVAAGLTGLVAVALGVWAWHNSLAGAFLATIAGAATTAVAAYVLVRTRALARAMKHPTQTIAQTKDLVLRAKGSPELHRLAAQVATRGARTQRGVGRMRRALSTGRLISSVIGLAAPDPERHDLLIPFTPARLRLLWVGVTIGLWAWLVSAVIASFAVLSLVIQGR